MVNDIEGLGLLLDLHNFAPQRRFDGRKLCAPYARAMHVKTFAFDENGNETTEDERVNEGIQVLLDAGYNGVWGVESVPADGDEITGARNTIALFRRLVR
jgi:hypothetical protein